MLGIVIAFAVFIVISCIGSNSNSRYIENNFGKIGGAEFIFDEADGSYAFTKKADEDFKILQLTDVHLGGGIFCIGKDKKALDAVYKMINGVKPDLVVFTGDVLYPFPFHSGNVDNLKTARQFADFMEKLQVPWTMTLGNHDAEAFSFAGRERLADFFAYTDLDYCLFTKNPTGVSISGYGNQIIKILNPDGTLNNALVFLDSNSYVKGNSFKYDIIHDDQVEWYKNSLRALSTPQNGFENGQIVPSLLFTHIPLNEYQYAWDAYNDGNSSVEYLWGIADEKILAPATGKKYAKGMIFEAIKELGSTKAVFCGHNHKNNFAIVYQGVQLTFSKSIVYLGLGGIGSTDKYRGGTTISINSNGDFTSASVGINEV